MITPSALSTVLVFFVVVPALVGGTLLVLELDQCQEETGRECVVRVVPVEFDQ